ncbi:MAG: TetR/AcrR family transcriptional regulator [Pseudonocardia sp.]
MTRPAGLRERKKLRTRETIADVAIAMFLAEGFDRVSCAKVAAQAEVSKPTLFKYFPAKEDLVLYRLADHQDEAADVVRSRRSGESPLDALRRHFLAGLAARDPITGLNDAPEVIGLYRMIEDTTSLSVRMLGFTARRAEALAEALTQARPSIEVPTRLVAHQITVTLRVLAEGNLDKLAGGRTADEVYPEAVSAADRAFGLLRNGLGAIL